MAITGPFVRVTSSFAKAKQQVWYRSNDRTIPLIYTMEDWNVVSCAPNGARGVADCPATYWQPHAELASNKAMAKLQDVLGDASSWGETIVQARATAALAVEGALGTLIKFTRQVHRFDFFGAARTLKMAVPRGLKPTAKAFAENWLAFHFGWEPLVKDIYASAQHVLAPYPPHKVRAKGTYKDFAEWQSASSAFNQVFTTRVLVGCEVVISDENAYSRQQMGLQNPFSLAWELVPFSFVVDWFANVGQCIGQYSMFAGLSVTKPFNTVYSTALRIENPLPGTSFAVTAAMTSAGVYRRQGLPPVTLRIAPWKGVSMVRAATALSLLVVLLGGSK